MAGSLAHYLKALIATSVVMAIYSLTIVPLIEPEDPKSYQLPDPPTAQTSDRWWQPLFQPGDWQLQDPTVVHSSRGVLLANSWEQISPESWRLKPLTIILSDNANQSAAIEPELARKSWIISAQEAVIHFEHPFDMRSGTLPGVQKGQLSGEILISQADVANPNQRPWQLRTRDINIDRRRVWTQQEVLIEFENSRIRGRDLRINLLSGLLRQQPSSADEWASKFGPLEELELLHLNELSVALNPGGIWANVNPQLIQLDQPAVKLPARVEATCGGRFSFNFTKETATLTGGVHLQHFLGGLPPDEFLCHRMSVKLQTSADQEARAETGVQPANWQLDNNQQSSETTSINHRQSPLAGVEVRQLDAFGIDSLEEFVGEKWVELRSPIAGTAARSKRLHFDLIKQRIELFGKLEQPGATVSVAELNYRGFNFYSPTIQYQAPPSGLNGQSEHLGWLAAQGAGELSAPANSPVGEAHVRWQKSFKWLPTELPGEQLIELNGQTLVESKQQGFLAAERLKIWLSNLIHNSHAVSAPISQPTQGLQPKRVLAEGDSVIATNQAKVNVQSLDLTFNFPDQSPKQAAMIAPAGKNSLGQFVAQPESTTASGPKTTQQPVEINGQSLVATISSSDQQFWIDAMSIHGPLQLKSPSNQQQNAWRVDGNTLNLASTAQGDLDIEIEGQPAKIHVADGSIQGPRIGFNQKENRVWMDQPGEFTLPVQFKSGSTQFHWAKPLRCTWQKRMMFDGSRIMFEGDIELLGTLQQPDGLWFLKGTCQELELHMDQPMSLGQLGDLQQMAPSAPLQQILLRKQVDLMATHKDNLGNRLSRGRLLIPTDVAINLKQQKIIAAGPGRGLANFLGSPMESDRAVNTSQLQGAALNFRDSLVVFMDRRELVVDGNVKVLISPIESWDDALNPEQPARLSVGQLSSFSDQLKIYDTSLLNSTQSLLASQGQTQLGRLQWEAQAIGNVRFDGHTEGGQFSGSAYQVVYVQAKDLLRIAGDGRSKATIKKLPSFRNAVAEPAITWRLNSGQFNVKQRSMLDSQGIEIHYESPDAANQAPQTPQQPNLPGSMLPGTNPQALPPEGPAVDPRERSINRLLQGFGS